MKDKLEKLKAEIEDFKKLAKTVNGKTIQADYGDVSPIGPEMYHIEYLGDRCDRLYQMIQDLWNELYKHEAKHLPPIETPEQMERAIKALGLEDSYTVQKRQIYASTNGVMTNWFFEIHPKK